MRAFLRHRVVLIEHIIFVLISQLCQPQQKYSHKLLKSINLPDDQLAESTPEFVAVIHSRKKFLISVLPKQMIPWHR